MVNYNMQFLCLSLLLYIGMYHSRQKRLQTRKVHLFHQILAVSFFSVVFDIMMIYVPSHLAQMSQLVHQFTYHIFISSLILVLYLFCSYIILNIENYKMSSCIVRALLVLPMVIMLFGLVLVPFYYYLERNGIYTCRLIKAIFYISVGFYLTMNLYFLFRYWKMIEANRRNTILPGVIVMIVAFGIQGFFPQANISGIGVVFAVISIFFSLDSPESNIDKKSMVFTTEGFYVALKDQWNVNRNFKIISIFIKNINEIRAEYGLAAECILLRQVEEILGKKYGLELFLTYDGCVSIIIKKERKGKFDHKEIPKYLDQGFFIRNSTIYLNYEIHTIHSIEYQSPEETLEKILKTANEIQYVRDYSDVPTGLGNRNAYEKDMNHIFNMRKEYKSIWHLVMNVNNLKQVNDLYGRMHGDELLRECAKILKKIMSENHRVYRMVGDEFCVIILNESEEQVEFLLAQLELERQNMNKDRAFPISFTLGYSGFDPESDIDLSEVKVRADKMMYRNKGYCKAQLE